MLRYYEEQQLIDSTRTPGGQRQYVDGTVERVRLIHQFYAAGLPSRTIRRCCHAPTHAGRPRNSSISSPPSATVSTDRWPNCRGRATASTTEKGMITEAAEPGHPYLPLPPCLNTSRVSSTSQRVIAGARVPTVVRGPGVTPHANPWHSTAW